MTLLIHILAARDPETDWGKLVVGAIVVLFWIFGAIGQQLKKKKEQDSDWDPPVDPLPPPMPANFPPPMSPRTPPQPTLVVPPQVRTTRAVKAKNKPRTPAKVVAAPAPVEPPPPLPTASRPKPVAVDAVALSKFLKPNTLRDQFILTEILQPPMSMRPPK